MICKYCVHSLEGFIVSGNYYPKGLFLIGNWESLVSGRMVVKMENRKRKKVWKIVLIVIFIVIVFIFAGGFFAYKIWGEQIMEKMVAGKPGNAKEYDASGVASDPDGPLRGKTIIFLGSSVTEGAGSCGQTFVEYFSAKDGITAVKEAVGGTTLVTQDETSYIPRMETIDPNIPADAFVCQFSTNDATKGFPMGKLSESFDYNDFDTSTIAGSIEYIISYAQNTWNCPIIFYTGTKYDKEEYGQMVALLLEIQKKWDIGVINLWDDEDLNNISDEKRKLYMLDGIHPTKAGYLEWWFPAMEEYLVNYLCQ